MLITALTATIYINLGGIVIMQIPMLIMLYSIVSIMILPLSIGHLVTITTNKFYTINRECVQKSVN